MTVRDRLNNGTAVFGARVRTFSTTVVQLVGQVGLDYAYLDLEHAGFSPYDSTALEELKLAADHVDTGLVIRLPSADPSIVRKVLDAGIRTIILPRIQMATEVEQAVRAARFEYDGGPGERGYGTAPCNDWGKRPPNYTETEDKTTFVGVMLETEAALANVDEILSVPELGFAKIGAGDLSVSLGQPQEYDHPDVREAIETFEKRCDSADIPLGRGVSSTPEAKRALEKGYRLLDVGGDVGILREELTDRLTGLEHLPD